MRCSDCLEELVGIRFLVLKRVRDLPADLPDDMPEAERQALDALCFEPQPLCAGCAGWYGGDAAEVMEPG